MATAEPRSANPDPLRLAKPAGDDVEARRAKAKIEGQLFGSGEVVAVGRYRIEGRIGAGAMGVVYRAHDPDLARDVAVKVLNPDAPRGGDGGETRHARLIREARAMARLAHPNVIHVYDVGTVDEGVFIAMELVLGTDLASWLRETERPWRDVLSACVAAGRGIAAAHAVGLIHRDFKPENVLVGRDGRVRVVDFGLAGGTGAQTGPLESAESRPPELPAVTEELVGEDPHGDASLTRTGTILGTPKYMAPEQLAGSPGEQSDQFSFCVTVFEALYGCPPFEGATLSAYRSNVRHGRVIAPPSGTSVPRAVYDQLVRGLSAQPDARHPTMDSLLDELEQFVGDDRRRGTGVFGRVLGLGAMAMAAAIVGAFAVDRSDDPDPASKNSTAHAAATDRNGLARRVEPARPRPAREHPPSPAAAPPPTPLVPKDSAPNAVDPPAETGREVTTDDSARPNRATTNNASNRTCYYLQDKWKKLGERRTAASSTFVKFSDACYECWQQAPVDMVANLQDADHCGRHVACTPAQGSDTARCSE